MQPRGSPQVQPAGSGSDLLGAAAQGADDLRSIELGTLWKNELGERTLEMNGQRAKRRTPRKKAPWGNLQLKAGGRDRSGLFLLVTATLPQLLVLSM